MRCNSKVRNGSQPESPTWRQDGTRRTLTPVTELEAELARLRQENARLRIEKEILKKAAAYFAKESM